MRDGARSRRGLRIARSVGGGRGDGVDPARPAAGPSRGHLDDPTGDDDVARSCLFSDQEYDVRSLLRAGATDEELAALWRGAMWQKWAGHGIGTDGFVPPERTMGAIGG